MEFHIIRIYEEYIVMADIPDSWCFMARCPSPSLFSWPFDRVAGSPPARASRSSALGGLRRWRSCTRDWPPLWSSWWDGDYPLVNQPFTMENGTCVVDLPTKNVKITIFNG